MQIHVCESGWLFFSHWVTFNSLRPNRLQHAWLPCPSLSPGVCLNSYPLSWWCRPPISSFVAPFSSCPQPFPASGSFPMSWLFTSCSQSNGASAWSLGTVFNILLLLLFSCSIMSVSLQPHRMQHARLPYHQLVELVQTHVHWVGDAIQPSHPLSSPSPPAFNLSQHQDLFQWVGSSRQVAKVLELQHQSFQWKFRTDFL